MLHQSHIDQATDTSRSPTKSNPNTPPHVPREQPLLVALGVEEEQREDNEEGRYGSQSFSKALSPMRLESSYDEGSKSLLNNHTLTSSSSSSEGSESSSDCASPTGGALSDDSRDHYRHTCRGKAICDKTVNAENVDDGDSDDSELSSDMMSETAWQEDSTNTRQRCS